MRLRTIALLATLAAAPAALADYPTDPEERDELCRDIVGTKVTRIPPKDLVWFQEHCRCVDGIGCGDPNSKSFQAKLAATEKKAAEDDANRVSTEQTRAADACKAFVGCAGSHPGDAGACGDEEARFEYGCSALRRDLEACRETIAGIRKDPAAADCAAALRSE
jgi:hypothetical protein